MYYSNKNKKQILSVTDDFLDIISVDKVNNVVVADLYYSVNQFSAIQEEALSVVASVIFKKTTINPILALENDRLDPKSVIRNLSTQIRDIKINSKNQENFILSKKNSDITSKINNENLPALKTGNRSLAKSFVTVKSEKASNLKNLGLNVSNISVKNSYMPLSSSASENESKKLFNNILLKERKDPSTFISSFQQTTTALESRLGTFRKVSQTQSVNSAKLSKIVDSSLQNIVKKTLNDYFDDDLIDIVTTEKQVNLNIPIRISIKLDSVNNNEISNLLFKFELLSSRTGLVVDSVSKELDIFKSIKFFLTPKLAPTVDISTTTNSKIILSVKQNDPIAKSVNIYRRIVSTSNIDFPESYEFLGNFETGQFGSIALIKLDNATRTATSIFRVIPIGEENNEGFEYTNVVHGTNKNIHIKSISLSTFKDDDSVRVEARNIPTDVVSIKFLVRNLSLKEKTFRIVNNEIFLITNDVRLNDYISVLDSSVKINNVYEYSVKLIFGDGIEIQSSNSIIEYRESGLGGLSTVVENLSISENDVSFSMTTSKVKTNLDVIFDSLKKQNSDVLFQNELFDEKDKLSSLVVHNVQRVNLDTGKRDDFGIILEDSFAESAYRELNNIEPFDNTKNYRYEVTAFVRNLETLFEGEKTLLDPATKKEYKFSPLKFRHPLNKRSGMIVTQQGINSRFSKNEFAHGSKGDTVNIDAGSSKIKKLINDVKSDMISRNFSIISWSVEDLDDIDHFVIMAESNGNNFPIGKTHANFQNNFCYYMHDISIRKFKSIRYAILPIYKTYEIGTLQYSNTIQQ
jgi:hypothetical protein